MITGRGTDEAVWLPHLAGLGLPELDRTPPPERVVVLAPHPDDEVLAVGGLLALLDTQVQVIAVTDGEASHDPAPQHLGETRMHETEAALAALRVPADVRRLRLPDGGAAALEQPVADAVRTRPSDWLLAPVAHDGHPDHEAVSRAATHIAQRDGARLLTYPVWAWHWLTPGDARLPLERAQKVQLPPEVRQRKARAVSRFRTQLEGPDPVLPPHVLARFARPYEVVLA